MVRIIVFVPSPDMLEAARRQTAELESNEIGIDVVHHFGTPQFLTQLEKYDVFVARGITYNQICGLYPGKHIIPLSLDGLDLMAELLQCRDRFHPKHIGLCLSQTHIPDRLEELERLCGVKISLYDVQDEPSAHSTVDSCLRDGVDVIVGGGTVSNICRERGIPSAYIRMKEDAVMQAITESLKVARSINLERIKSHTIRMILNNSNDAVLALDGSGHILEANDKAYRLYDLAALPEWRGRPIELFSSQLTYIGSRTVPCRDGDEELVTLKGQRYMVKYSLISGETSAIGTLITTSAISRILQDEQHLRKGLVRRGLTSKYTFRDIIAKSEYARSVVELGKKISRADSNVLLTGETGTGKELFAHSIHAASPRSNQPFVAVNCAALPETLLESELFGYEAGAFSGASRDGKAGLFEQAHRGTIFLDEIGELPVALQAKLLRVLQEKEIRRIGGTAVIPIDVRLISATNVNIQQQIQAGKFRSDLFYRLNTLEISIPPLRERPEDIIPLMEHQLRIIAAKQGDIPPKLTAEAQMRLRQYDWPGNVRELCNVCERLVVLSTSEVIDEAALTELRVFRPPAAPSSAPQASSQIYPTAIQPVVRKKDLARELGVSRTTLWRMSKRQEEQKK